MKLYDVASNDFLARFAEIEAKRPEAVARGIRSAAAAGALVLAKAAPVGVTYQLKNSVRAEFVGKGAVIVIDAPYAAMVEVGSRPHRPPIGPLLQWVIVKLGIADVGAAMGVARAIQMKISREGTKPQWFVRKRLPLLRRILKAEVEAELKRGG